MKTSFKSIMTFKLAVLAGFLATACTTSHGALIVYQSDFTGTTLASAGLAASAGAAGGGWTITAPQLVGTGGGNARASVYTSDSWQSDGGFSLDVTFFGNAALVRHSFGIVDAAWSVPTAQDWLNESPAGAYGIGFSTAGSGPSDYLGFNNDAGIVTVLSTAQGDKTSALSEIMNITVTADSWSYSLNGQPATTGVWGTPFDTSRDYRFIAYAQRANRATFSNITLTAIPEPSTYVIFSLMLLAGAGYARQRKRAA